MSDDHSIKLKLNSHFSELSLDEWISKFGRIYGKRHDKHTTEYMISRLVEEVAELVNPMESQDKDKLGPNLADVFSWICSISFKLKIDLANLAWEKYRKNAPRPSWTRDSVGPVFSIESFSEPRTLPEWQDFISNVYKAENAMLTPMNALVAMMKDVGDLAMNQRKRESQEQTSSKLAAILAWTLTIAQLIKLDLAEAVHGKYDDKCPVCQQAICDTDVCHPLTMMYVSFGSNTPDEEKYVILDIAAKHSFKTLVDGVPELHSTKDLSESLDLISRSDVACILFSNEKFRSTSSSSEYRQVFEVMACYSVLSKGNVWIFTKDGESGFAAYLRQTFDIEKPSIAQYSDPGHLKAIFDRSLDELIMRKTSSLASSWTSLRR